MVFIVQEDEVIYTMVQGRSEEASNGVAMVGMVAKQKTVYDTVTATVRVPLWYT